MNKPAMIKKYLPLTLIALSAVTLIGCSKTLEPQMDAVSVDNSSFEQVWDACLASLEDHSFEVDRRDRRFGVIVSEAVVGKQFFEFWRNDTANSDDLLNSSLHTIRRVVTIRIAKQGPTEFEVDVEAQAQRISVPGTQLNSTTEAFELMSSQGVPVSPRRSDYLYRRGETIWVDIGREQALEQAIMRDIAGRLESERTAQSDPL